MTRIRVAVLGRTRVEVDGQVCRLAPTATAVLIRLLVAEGQLVTVDQLFRDVWRATTLAVRREDRVSVQKRIGELRKVLDLAHPGETSEILPTDRGRTSAYRLVLGVESVDLLQFCDLIERARSAEATNAVELLQSALALWKGRPLFDVEDYAFAEKSIRRLVDLHRTACLDLLRAYQTLGMAGDALRIATAILADNPDDDDVRDQVGRLRQRMAGDQGIVLRHEFRQPRMRIVVSAGDLFDQDDAHLVVGFSDTFDTATNQDTVISGSSVQGQLVKRIYDGDRARLDRDLHRALNGVPRIADETRATKRQGKLVRYPVGTVAVLQHAGRRIFAVAYSHMGNDLVARSSAEYLSLALDRLWDSVYRNGQYGVLATPLVGTGLARINFLDYDDLLKMIIRSFVERSREQPLCRELRIVVLPSLLDRVNLLDVSALIREL